MEKFSNKIGLSILWLLGAAIFTVYKTMAINQNAYNASLLKSEESAYIWVFVLFAFLSLVLEGNWRRETNIIAGICVGVVQLIVFTDGITGYPSAKFNILTIISILILGLIVWFSYKLPRKEKI